MPASENIRQLVKRFEDNRESYRSGKYNETQLRREFLDPFFETLGRDVFNKGGYAKTYIDFMSYHKQSPRTPQEQEMVKREIESTDKGINKLVYELYGLNNEEEINIVEGEG